MVLGHFVGYLEFSKFFSTLSRKTLWEGTIHLETFKDSPGEERFDLEWNRQE
jgi:hypothetical protein